MTISSRSKPESTKRSSPASRRLFDGRLRAVKALSMIGSLTLATGGLMTVSSLIISPANASPAPCGVPTDAGLQQNLNTTLGCDVVEGSSLMSGYISDTGLQPGQILTLEDAYEGLSSQLFYWGTYTLTLDCQSGTASAASTTYVIAQNTGSYPLSPPAITSGTLPTVTADANGTIVCAYTLAVQNAPSGHLNSSKSDLWIVDGGSGHTATTSVKPPQLGDPSDPTTVPTTDPTTVPDDPTTVPTTVPTTDPTTVPDDPTTVPTTDPTTVPNDPTTVPTTDPTTAPDDPTTVPTTAPLLQTNTVSDPSNGQTHPVDPKDPAASYPVAGELHVPAGSTTTAEPANATFNPRGLSALAFTGSNTGELAAIGLVLILFGGLVLGISRRWVRSRAR